MTNLKHRLLILVASCCLAASASAFPSHIVVHDMAGTASHIVLDPDMRLSFDPSYLEIGGAGAPVIYRIEDIAKLTYDIPTGITPVKAACSWQFSSTGITLTMNGPEASGPTAGNHYSILTINGTVVAEGDFAARCVIPSEKLPEGVVIIRINGSDAIKLLVRNS